MSNLDRFIKAQQSDYDMALAEIKNGRKRSHWMWYIFPQVQGLGLSSMSQHYSIKDLTEAQDYLAHPVLGQRLVAISTELLKLRNNDATAIFGSPDNMKLSSSMTLFSLVLNADPVFQQVLDKFFDGEKDPQTLRILEAV
jgi:uncharacterized protein (DUF1810 family)